MENLSPLPQKQIKEWKRKNLDPKFPIPVLLSYFLFPSEWTFRQQSDSASLLLFKFGLEGLFVFCFVSVCYFIFFHNPVATKTSLIYLYLDEQQIYSKACFPMIWKTVD